MLLVRVLGSTAVTAIDERLDLGPRRHSEVLAILAAAGGHHVSALTLCERLWRGDPPRTAATTLQGYISRLRRVLEPPVAGGTNWTSVVTSGSGYRLGTGVTTDAMVFEAEVSRARELLDGEHRGAAEAASILEAALHLWRGPAYVDVRDVEGVAPEAERLEELRIVARELRAQAALACGGEAAAVPALRALAAEHPLRERATALLATALYRSGCPADALATIRNLRSRLVEQVGADPGAEIVRLERQILTHDPALDAPASASDITAGTGPYRAGARSNPGADFVGREAELMVLQEAWARARAGELATAVVRGEAGIGKTRLIAEFVDSLRSLTTSVRWGRCLATSEVPSYWPWKQILDDLPESDVAAGADRFALGVTIAGKLRQLSDGNGGGQSAHRGAVIIVDDAQWADPDSLVVLDIVLHTLSSPALLVILSLRDDMPRAPQELQRALATFARREGNAELGLTGLDERDVSELVSNGRSRGRALRTDQLHPGDAETAAELVSRTGGNPFFVGSLLASRSHGELPRGIRDSVLQRLSDLPEGAHELAAVLAAAGRPIPLTVCARVLGRHPAEIEQLVVFAVRAALIDEAADGHLRLRHELVRETVAGTLGPAVRAELNRRLNAARTTAGVRGSRDNAEQVRAAVSGSIDRAVPDAPLAPPALISAQGRLVPADRLPLPALSTLIEEDCRHIEALPAPLRARVRAAMAVPEAAAVLSSSTSRGSGRCRCR